MVRVDGVWREKKGIGGKGDDEVAGCARNGPT